MTRTVATQKGLHLRAANHLVSEVPVPVPPADHNAIQTATYASLLKVRLHSIPDGCRTLFLLDVAGANVARLVIDFTLRAAAAPQRETSEFACHTLLSTRYRPTTFDPPSSSCLQGTDPQHLLFAEVPLSEALGRRVVLVYDASGSGAPNAVASRLTTGVHDGLALQVRTCVNVPAQPVTVQREAGG